MEYERDLSARLSALRVLHRVVADLNTAGGLTATLQAVADAVVSSLGFEAAAVNVVRSDGDLEVTAVAGDPEARRVLADRTRTHASWNAAPRLAGGWGARPPLTSRGGIHPDRPRWVPGPLPHAEPEWHPVNALLAPMITPVGELVGVLSVTTGCAIGGGSARGVWRPDGKAADRFPTGSYGDDPLTRPGGMPGVACPAAIVHPVVNMPHDGRRPDLWQRELLEMFAAQAAIAIDNARLRAEALRAVARLEAEQRALRASEESFRQAFDNAPSGMAMTSLREPDVGRMLRVNEAFCRLLGYPERALRRMRLPTVVHPKDRAAVEYPRTTSGCRELRLVRRDGSMVWVSLRASVVPDASGRPHFLLSHVEDIEDRRRHEQHLAHRASHDPLTGLTNRIELRARLDHMLASGFPLAVLFCDLDGFKNVNDQYGHHGGDAVLIEVAQRLRAGVRTKDTVARVGGDEFVVVAGGVSRPEADDLVDRLAGTFLTPVSWEGHVIPIAASFGVSWADQDLDADTLLRVADQEMYKRKKVHADAHRRAG